MLDKLEMWCVELQTKKPKRAEFSMQLHLEFCSFYFDNGSNE